MWLCVCVCVFVMCILDVVILWWRCEHFKACSVDVDDYGMVVMVGWRCSSTFFRIFFFFFKSLMDIAPNNTHSGRLIVLLSFVCFVYIVFTICSCYTYSSHNMMDGMDWCLVHSICDFCCTSTHKRHTFRKVLQFLNVTRWDGKEALNK